MTTINKTVILHISDLHFGIEKKKPQITAMRKNILEEFKKSYSSLIFKEPNWAPDILVVSGDIAYDGSPDDYKQAETFFKWITNKKLKGNKISRSDVILCFGNHDVYASDNKFEPLPPPGFWVDYAAKTSLYRPDPNCDFKEYYEFDLDIDKRYHRFKNAESFCKKMKFTALKSDSKSYKYAYGYRSVKGIDFIALNTEWDFWGPGDKDAKDTDVLRIGSDICLKTMKNFGNLFDLSSNPRFVVYHRPLTNLHKQEQYEPGIYAADRNNRKVGNIIVRRNDVSLNGHIHRDTISEKSTHTIITAGSVHSTDTWDFSCNLIFVPKILEEGYNECTLRLFKYFATLDHNAWMVNKVQREQSFSIYRNNDSELVGEFVAAYDGWIENRSTMDHEEADEYKNRLKQLLDQLENKVPILITIFGRKGLIELKKEIEGTKLATSTLPEKHPGKDVNYKPFGGGGGNVTKSEEMDKELNKGPYDISAEGYLPSSLSQKNRRD